MKGHAKMRIPELCPEADGARFVGVSEFGFLDYTIIFKGKRHVYTFAPEMWPHIKAMILHMDGWMKANPKALSILTKPLLSGHVTGIDSAIAPINTEHNARMKKILDRLEKAIEKEKDGKEK